ncbi:MAG: malate synthase, partial [Sphingobacteriales bacterium]
MRDILQKIKVLKNTVVGQDKVLSAEALDFLSKLHENFNPTRKELLLDRNRIQTEIDKTGSLGLLKETANIRESEWQVAQIPDDLQKRNVEITGPVDRKMVINALNSGADVFMADFEDSTSPTWENLMNGQINLGDAIRRNIDFVSPQGKSYKLNDKTATLVVRARGWHLDEKHLELDGEKLSGSMVDFGLYAFNNHKTLIENGTSLYFYLPKIQDYREAKLWDDIFSFTEKELGMEHGSIKATVLIETIHGAFQMEEIAHALKDHLAGLNAGRWDYIFSVIKTKFHHKDSILPDRACVTMTSGFMQAYAEKMVDVCHRRGAHAIGGMAAFIPSKDLAVNEKAFEKVKTDKEREASQGFDGTWVAHPGLVDVARNAFDKVLNGELHQKEVNPKKGQINHDELSEFHTEGEVTKRGLAHNLNIAVHYMAYWLSGTGAVALNNLMEDAA